MAYRDSTTASGTSGTASVAAPTNQVGDVIVVTMETDARLDVIGPPTGFTEAKEVDITGDGAQCYICWKRVAGSPDAGSYTISGMSSSDWVMQAFAFSGRHATDPPTFSADSVQNTPQSSPITITANGVTAVAGDDLLWISMPDVTATGVGNGHTPPSGYTEAEDAEQGWSNLSGAYKQNVGAGATGSVSGTFALTGNTAAWGAWLVRIPAAAGGATPVDGNPLDLVWDLRAEVSGGALDLLWDLMAQVNGGALDLVWDLRADANGSALDLVWDTRAQADAGALDLVWDLRAAVDAGGLDLLWDLRASVDGGVLELVWDLNIEAAPVNGAALDLLWDLVGRVDALSLRLKWDLAAEEEEPEGGIPTGPTRKPIEVQPTSVNARPLVLLWDVESPSDAGLSRQMADSRAAATAEPGKRRGRKVGRRRRIKPVEGVPLRLYWQLPARVSSDPLWLYWDLAVEVDGDARPLGWDVRVGPTAEDDERDLLTLLALTP